MHYQTEYSISRDQWGSSINEIGFFDYDLVDSTILESLGYGAYQLGSLGHLQWIL
jgi:hypothetical protein